MRYRLAAFTLLAALMAVSCSDAGQELMAPTDVAFEAVAPAGNDNAFSFLPPLANTAPPSGSFDATLLPYLSVEICHVEDGECVPVATLDADGSRSERLRLDEDGEAYHAVWSTRGLNTGSYRLQVRAVTLKLASLGVEIVARGRALRGVPDGALGVVRNRSVPIKFWVGQGAAQVVGPSGGTVTGLGGRVTLAIPEGALPEPFALAIEPTDPEDGTAELAFELAPWDAGFVHPVTLSVRNDPLAIPDDPADTHEYILQHDDADGAWHEVPSVYDYETGEVRLELTTFAWDPVDQPEPPALPEDEPAGGAVALDLGAAETAGLHSLVLPRPTIPRIRLPRYRVPAPTPTVRRACVMGTRVNPSTAAVTIGGEAYVTLEAARMSSTGPFGIPSLRWYPVSASGGAWTTTSSVIDVEPGRVIGVAAGTGAYRVGYPSPERSYCRSSYALGSAQVAAPTTDAIALDATELALEVGQTATLGVTLTAADGSDLTGLRPVTFAAGDETVATVNGDGEITAVAAGNTTITVTSDGVTATATLTVTAPPPPPGPSSPWEDGEFDPANWAVTLVTDGNGGTVDVTSEGSGGTPGRFMRIAQHFAAGTESNPSGILTFHARDGAVYAPATDGAIESIDYSESAILFECEFTACHGQLTGPALLQDGHIFVHSADRTSYAEYKDLWGDISANGLTASDFRQVMDASQPGVLFLGSRTPDFTAQGAPIQFGFHRWGAHNNSLTPTRTAGIDNWALTVNPVPPPAPVATVSVTPSSATVETGGVQAFTAEARSAEGDLLDRTIAWTLTPGSGQATLVANGATAEVTGDGAGEVTVTATSEGVSGSAVLTVEAPVTGTFEVYGNSSLPNNADNPLMLDPQDRERLTFKFYDENGAEITGEAGVALWLDLMWSSSDPQAVTMELTEGRSCATIDGAQVCSGWFWAEAVALRPGSEALTFEHPTHGTTVVSVEIRDPVWAVELSPTTADVELGSTLTVTPNITLGSGAATTDPTLLAWSSSAPGVAAVDANGQVTGVSEGTATITAQADGKFAQMTVTVVPPTIVAVTLDAPATELEVGETLQLTATATDADGNGVPATIEWVSLQPGVATVDATGLVTGVAAGTAQITVAASNSASSAQESVDLTVTEPVSRPTAEGEIPTTAELPFYGGHDVAVADDGTGYAVWCAAGTLAVARSLNGTTWELMGSRDVGSCGVDAQSHAGVDASGTLYMAHPTGLYTSSDGGATITGPAALPAVAATMAVRADGAVFIATRLSSTQIEIHRSNGGGPLNRVQTLHSPYSGQQIGSPDLAVDGQGTLHMVWRRTNSVGHFHDYLRSSDGVSWSAPESFTDPNWSHQPAKIAADPTGNLIVVFETFNSNSSQSEQWTYTSTTGGSSWGFNQWSTQAFMTDQAPLAAGRVVQYFTTSAFEGFYGRNELYVHEWAGSWGRNIAFLQEVTEADLDANASGRLCVVAEDRTAWCEDR